MRMVPFYTTKHPLPGGHQVVDFVTTTRRSLHEELSYFGPCTKPSHHVRKQRRGKIHTDLLWLVSRHYQYRRYLDLISPCRLPSFFSSFFLSPSSVPA